MVVVPAGVAMLGSPLGESGRQTFEAAPHPVEIGKPFAVGRYAVTFAQWDACYAEGGCGHRRLGDLDFGRGNHPAIFATWTEAQLYVDWLKRKTGQPYRLLSESEWEFAARGCRTLKCAYAPFWFGPIKPELAVYDSRRSYDGSPKAAAMLKTAPVDNGSRESVRALQYARQCAAMDRRIAGTRPPPPRLRTARRFSPEIAPPEPHGAARGRMTPPNCELPRATTRASTKDPKGSGSAWRGI